MRILFKRNDQPQFGGGQKNWILFWGSDDWVFDTNTLELLNKKIIRSVKLIMMNIKIHDHIVVKIYHLNNNKFQWNLYDFY